MADLAEEYRELREINKLARWARYEKSIEALEKSGIPFTEKANGHCIVGEEDMIFDFWATKGLFIQRGTGKRGNGIENMVKILRDSAIVPTESAQATAGGRQGSGGSHE
jgi:hypothetical protein